MPRKLEKTPAQKARTRWNNHRKKLRPIVFARDGYSCADCAGRNNLSIDHIVSLKDGGDPVALSNLVTRCKKCHRAKDNQCPSS